MVSTPYGLFLFKRKGSEKMYRGSFTFGNWCSDEFGVMAVSLESASSRFNKGQVSEIVTDKAALVVEYQKISQNYKEPMEFTLQVINKDGSDISSEQERAMSKAFCNRGDYEWLFIHDERFGDAWVRAKFYNPQTWTVMEVKGIQYTVQTSSPVAFSDEYENTHAITDTIKTISIYVNNDEEIEIYPELEITMLEAGNLIISNSAETDNTYKTEIKNLQSGEIITIKDENITTSRSGHDIMSDSNLICPRLYDEENTLTFNLKCTVLVKYREYRKLVINFL